MSGKSTDKKRRIGVQCNNVKGGPDMDECLHSWRTYGVEFEEIRRGDLPVPEGAEWAHVVVPSRHTLAQLRGLANHGSVTVREDRETFIEQGLKVTSIVQPVGNGYDTKPQYHVRKSHLFSHLHNIYAQVVKEVMESDVEIERTITIKVKSSDWTRQLSPCSGCNRMTAHTTTVVGEILLGGECGGCKAILCDECYNAENHPMCHPDSFAEEDPGHGY